LLAASTLDEKWGLQHFPAWLLFKEQGLSLHLVANTDYTPVAFIALFSGIIFLGWGIEVEKIKSQ